MAGALGLAAIVLLVVLLTAYGIACGLTENCDMSMWLDAT
jgi:hypothetical protein